MVHHHRVTLGVEGERFRELVARARHQRRCRGEPLGCEVARPPIDHHHAEAHVRREAYQGPRIVAGAQHDQLRRRSEYIDEHGATRDLVNPGFAGLEQLSRFGRRPGVQVLRTQVAFGTVARHDQPFHVSRVPFPVDRAGNGKGRPPIE